MFYDHGNDGLSPLVLLFDFKTHHDSSSGKIGLLIILQYIVNEIVRTYIRQSYAFGFSDCEGKADLVFFVRIVIYLCLICYNRKVTKLNSTILI